MTLQDIITDIHALHEDVEMYERKYGVLTETFYEVYTKGIEPEDDSWVLDWADWAGAYTLLQQRLQQYQHTIHALQIEQHSLVNIITKTARHETIPIAA